MTSTEQTKRSATSEEIEEWNEENDEPHPVFAVPHRPERVAISDLTESEEMLDD